MRLMWDVTDTGYHLVPRNNALAPISLTATALIVELHTLIISHCTDGYPKAAAVIEANCIGEHNLGAAISSSYNCI